MFCMLIVCFMVTGTWPDPFGTLWHVCGHGSANWWPGTLWVRWGWRSNSRPTKWSLILLFGLWGIGGDVAWIAEEWLLVVYSSFGLEVGPPRFCTAIRIQKLVFCIKVKHKSMCAHKWWNSLRQKMTITVYFATFFFNFLEILDWGESLCGHKEQGHAHLMLTHLNLNMLIHLNPSQSWQRPRTPQIQSTLLVNELDSKKSFF